MIAEMKPVKMRDVRIAQGKSKAQVSRETCMQASMIAWIEDGRFIPYDKQLEKIAIALEWDGDPRELLEQVS